MTDTETDPSSSPGSPSPRPEIVEVVGRPGEVGSWDDLGLALRRREGRLGEVVCVQWVVKETDPQRVIRLSRGDIVLQSIWRCVKLQKLALRFVNPEGVVLGNKPFDGLQRLEYLREFILTNTPLKELPTELRNATQLEVLRLSKSRELATIPSWIADFPNLKLLDLEDCGTECLPWELARMNSLKQLVLRGTMRLRQPPRDIFGIWLFDATYTAKEAKRYLSDMSLNHEIEARDTAGEFGSSAVSVYVVGKSGVGKSSIIQRVTGSTEHRLVTRMSVPVSLSAERIVPMTLCFWDFSRQDDYRCIHRFWLRQNSVYILVLDGTKHTEPGLLEWYNQVRFWMGSITSIVGTRLETLVLVYHSAHSRKKSILRAVRRLLLDLGPQRYGLTERSFRLLCEPECDHFDAVKDDLLAKARDLIATPYRLLELFEGVANRVLLSSPTPTTITWTQWLDACRRYLEQFRSIIPDLTETTIADYTNLLHNKGVVVLLQTESKILLADPQWVIDKFRMLVSSNDKSSLTLDVLARHHDDSLSEELEDFKEAGILRRKSSTNQILGKLWSIEQDICDALLVMAVDAGLGYLGVSKTVVFPAMFPIVQGDALEDLVAEMSPMELSSSDKDVLHGRSFRLAVLPLDFVELCVTQFLDLAGSDYWTDKLSVRRTALSDKIFVHVTDNICLYFRQDEVREAKGPIQCIQLFARLRPRGGETVIRMDDEFVFWDAFSEGLRGIKAALALHKSVLVRAKNPYFLFANGETKHCHAGWNKIESCLLTRDDIESPNPIRLLHKYSAPRSYLLPSHAYLSSRCAGPGEETRFIEVLFPVNEPVLPITASRQRTLWIHCNDAIELEAVCRALNRRFDQEPTEALASTRWSCLELSLEACTVVLSCENDPESTTTLIAQAEKDSDFLFHVGACPATDRVRSAVGPVLVVSRFINFDLGTSYPTYFKRDAQQVTINRRLALCALMISRETDWAVDLNRGNDTNRSVLAGSVVRSSRRSAYYQKADAIERESGVKKVYGLDRSAHCLYAHDKDRRMSVFGLYRENSNASSSKAAAAELAASFVSTILSDHSDVLFPDVGLVVPMPSDKPIIWVHCALWDELKAALGVFTRCFSCDAVPEFSGYPHYRLDCGSVVVGMSCNGDGDQQGRGNTSPALIAIKNRYVPVFVFMTGICGGNPRRVDKGHLVIAKQAVEFYSEGDSSPRGVPRREVRDRIVDIVRQRSVQWRTDETWKHHLERGSLDLAEESRFQTHVGAIISAEPVRNDLPDDMWSQYERQLGVAELYGVECEALTLYDTWPSASLCVKGVQDVAFEKDADGKKFRSVAASLSASLVASVVQSDWQAIVDGGPSLWPSASYISDLLRDGYRLVRGALEQ